MIDLKLCPKCKIAPIQQTRCGYPVALATDERYPITDGRYVCPKCGFGPSWGEARGVDYGWEKAAEAWNRRVN